MLRWCARRVIKKYQPTIIGITGSVGKTSTREAIAAVLSREYDVRKSAGNYNNEIGMPLTILGEPSPGKSFWGWVRVFLRAFGIILVRRPYPEILVLEMGVDKPGDMDYLLTIAQPHIAVVTAVGAIPVHVEFFKDAAGVAKEKSKIVRSLERTDIAVLNFDDPVVREFRGVTKAKTVTFGFDEGALIRGTDVVLNSRDWQRITSEGGVKGVSLKLHAGKAEVPIRLPFIFGRHQASAALAAAAVGSVMGMNLVKIGEALMHFHPPKGRTRLIPGIKGIYLIDDSYNASPDSTRAALSVLAELSLAGGRKIAVLGDMLELGTFTEKGHRAIGTLAAQSADMLVAVGVRAKFIADEARKQGMAEDHIFECETSSEAGLLIQNKLLRAGDLVLIKGSQSMRMEKITKELMAEPERAGEFLVRQSEDWLKK